jgi:hypothetical protein
VGWRSGAAQQPDESPAPSGVVVTYDSASVAEARAVIAHGIERRVPLLTLTGKVGAGTSAVLHSLYERFAQQCDLALPAEPPATVTDLTVPVLRLLGRPFIDAPAPELLATICEALDARAASPRPLALLLDDAESLPDDVLEALAAFGSTDGTDRARLPVVLAGRPGLLARLSAAKLAPLRRGLTIDVRLHTPQSAALPLPPAAPVSAPRRTGRPRVLLLAVLCAALCGATALYLQQPLPDAGRRALPPDVLRTHRPAALAAILVPPTKKVPAAAEPPSAPAPAPDGATDQQRGVTDEARRLVEEFQRAVAAGDAETIRSLLAPDVRYNGVIGVDAALDDQVWLGRGQDRPRFAPPDAAQPVADAIRVESRFVVPFRDVAGAPGEVAGRAVWEVARRAGVLQIVAVDYDILPTAASAPRDG